MKLPWPRILLVANVVALLLVALFLVDVYVRWRIGQAVTAYHNGTIMPMVTPRPPQTPPK